MDNHISLRFYFFVLLYCYQDTNQPSLLIYFLFTTSGYRWWRGRRRQCWRQREWLTAWGKRHSGGLSKTTGRGDAEDDGGGKVMGDGSHKVSEGGGRLRKGKMGADSSNAQESKRETAAATATGHTTEVVEN